MGVLLYTTAKTVMGRPSKLTEKQWAEIEKRVPPLGNESMRAVAKELGVSEGVIRSRVKTRTKPETSLANQIAMAELAFESLPINTQVKVRTLADRLKGISENLAGAADLGAQTANKLALVANAQALKIDETKPLGEADVETLKAVVAMTNAANGAAQIGLNLLASNKDTFKEHLPVDVKPMTLAEFYGQANTQPGA